MTVRVAVFGHSAELGGAELSLVFCVKRMLSAGMEVKIFLPRSGPLVRKLHELDESLPIEFLRLRWWMGKRQKHIVGLVRTIQALWDTFGAYRVLKNHNPQAILVISSVTPAPLLASKLLGIPSVLTLGESFKTNPTLKSFLPKKIIGRILDICSDRVLACSRFVANQYGYKSEVSYPEIDEFSVRKPKQRNLQVPKIVMLGSYSSEKGQDLAVEVARELCSHSFAFQLDFYGWGDEDFLNSLKQKSGEYKLGNKVNFRPPTNSVFSVLENATYSFVFSGNEAFGKVTLESLSQGTPVFGLDAGGTSEILEKGGGILVSSNPEEIAEKIISVTRDPATYRQMQLSAISNEVLYQFVGTRRDICAHLYEVSTLIPNAEHING